ncbi:MAG: NADPH-dependent glutamate synthase [Firmicutes bacterium]|nr:NADPH-dependent glutamate synthase [Bacillota bacterium]
MTLVTSHHPTASHDLTGWHALHEEALQRLNALEAALHAEDWQGVDRASQWVYAVLRPHNEGEERELFPMLEEIGAEQLYEQLSSEHREMWDLNLQLLAAIDEGRATDVAQVKMLAGRLLALIRSHIDTEEHLMLPLLRGRSLWPSEEVTEDGYLILEKELVAPDTWSFVVQAPLIARGRKPGQFIMVSPFPTSERIPLTLVNGDPRKGWIRFVVMAVGATTRAMCKLSAGDSLYSVAGPMGRPTELVDEGTVVLVAGGYGAGAVLTAAEVLKARGQRVVSILGGRTKERVLLTEELGAASDELIITTDDGSWGRKGVVTEALKEVIDREQVAEVVAVGPMPMMEAVANLTKPYGIFTLVSLNAMMVDGTGMCGGCRVAVGDQVKFACFDGPDFDGHKVDFQMLKMRQNWYCEDEKEAGEHACRIGRNTGAPKVDADLPVIEPVADFDWRATDLAALKAPQRMKIPRQEMACQEGPIRINNFDEVSLGLNADQAQLEAARCLQCKKPACVDGCPVGIDIPAFLKEIEAGRPVEAGLILKRYSALPAVCGRVCPQEKQCEARCVVGIKGESVSIGRLERFAADSLLEGDSKLPEVATPTGKKVAIIGAGPAGLAVAGELVQKGHEITVFDALHKPGGVLLYGIPEFRLPNAIVDSEVEALRRLGVKFVMNTIVGRAMTLDELRQEYDAVFMGTGAGLPKMLGIPGEEFKGVYTANEFLTRVNLMRADLFPHYGTPITVGKHVIVVGCGNTAMDAARCSKRLGADVTIVYRRSVNESTARKEELEHAMEEGIEFRWLTTPLTLLGNEKGWITDAECALMELTEPGPDGRRGVRDTGQREILPCDTLIVALGCAVNPLISQTEERLKTLKGGVVVVDQTTGETTVPGVYAGGDVITGGATVILAMGQGHRAAEAMHRRLMGA